MKILIADSGSTKTHWCLVDEGGADISGAQFSGKQSRFVISQIIISLRIL